MGMLMEEAKEYVDEKSEENQEKAEKLEEKQEQILQNLGITRKG